MLKKSEIMERFREDKNNLGEGVNDIEERVESLRGLEGRDFQEEVAETLAVILNEAVRAESITSFADVLEKDLTQKEYKLMDRLDEAFRETVFLAQNELLEAEVYLSVLLSLRDRLWWWLPD